MVNVEVLGRLEVERRELNERYALLVAFMETKKYDDLPEAHRDLLCMQVGAMATYLTILLTREKLLKRGTV